METNTISPQIPVEDGGLDIPQIQRCIEAILFAAGHPITYAKLADVLSLTPGTVRHIVEDYASEYNREDSALPRGIILLTFEDSCQLCTREQYGSHIREALGIRRGGNLSASSIEVLAIVAYNEPVTRAYIDTVRGVDSSYSVTSLCEKHLIEPCGRLDVPGRPLLYRTTSDFLRVFGMQSLEDLPVIEQTAAAKNAAAVNDAVEAEAATATDAGIPTEVVSDTPAQ